MTAITRALVIGSSGAIGAAMASALAARGVGVVGLSRSGDGLDLADERSVEAALGALDGALGGAFDLVFVATGALTIGGQGPEKTVRDLTPEAMRAQFDLNTIGPAMVLKHARRLLPRDRPAVFAALSARLGSIGDNGHGGWYSYRAAKAALNQVIRTGAIELARSHRQSICVALHPGTVRSPLTEAYLGKHAAVTPAEAAARLIAVIAALTPVESGGFFDYSGARVVW